MRNEESAHAQSEFHGVGFDYDPGSPHLRHQSLRLSIEGDLSDLVSESFARSGGCSVLEVGAGHGTFTDCLISAGATVEVTEVSASSAKTLQRKFANNELVEVHFDMTGEEALSRDREFDLIVAISVLHHIPDYLSFVERIATKIRPGGAFYSAQDPLWYPRLARGVHGVHLAAYFAWRSVQGSYARGVSTRLRRLRGVYDDTEPSDLVEYHVVRKGVDEKSLERVLRAQFEKVDLFTYWSTHASLLQKLGERTPLKSNFGAVARGRNLPRK